MPPGRPPRLPSTAIRIPHTAAVPAALSPMSRAISQRRASRAAATRTITTPNEPAWYTTVTSHVMLHGGGWMTWVMARSIRESYRMTSRQHARARAATARRAPSLPRRRRWPLPTGANMTEPQPRRRLRSAAELSLVARFSVISAHRHSGRQDLGLLALELVGRDNATVAQVGQLGQLVGRVALIGGLLDVAADLLVLLLGLLLGALLHLATPGDQVDQDTDQRDEQHEHEPQRLRPARQVVAAEDVDEDVDQDPDPDNPQEDLEDRPECSEQRIGVGTCKRHRSSMSGNGACRAPRRDAGRAGPAGQPT